MFETNSFVGATVAAPPLVRVDNIGAAAVAPNAIEREKTPEAATVGRFCMAAAGVVAGSSMAAANGDAECDATSEVILGRCAVGATDVSALSGVAIVMMMCSAP